METLATTVPTLDNEIFEYVKMEWYNDNIYRFIHEDDNYYLRVDYIIESGNLDTELWDGEQELTLSSEQEDKIYKQIDNLRSYERSEKAHRDYVTSQYN